MTTIIKEHNNCKVLVIYISKSENERADIQQSIKDLKVQYKQTVIFISGESEIGDTLKEMVKLGSGVQL